jgi:hypothetical protein
VSEAYFQEGSEAMLALEAMVDRVGLRNVVYALSHIACEKGIHVRANWQDRALARRWEMDSRKLDLFAKRLNAF